MPPAGRFLFNRQYVVGYSYLFRQPRWALELIDDQTMQMEDEELERLDNFREDLRIPDMFRSTLDDYKGSGYDRGHLISSADRLGRAVVNSETFLMTNMSPQKPGFNRDVWKQLEQAARGLAAQEKYAEVYAICGPLFKIGDPIEVNWGIHLTQVTPRCSMRPCGGLSTRPARVRGMLRQRRGLSRLSVRVALAGGFPLSAMRA